MKKIYALIVISILSFSFRVFDSNYYDLSANFTQDWTTTSQITNNDIWTGVASIQGFLGQDITTSTGVDPQTLLVTSALPNDVDVIANQASPAITNGGVAEFDGIANPVVALQGSGTADAPHLIIYLNTTGRSNINVQYALRDIDATADNSIQPVALQYRVGNTGNFTNIAAGFVADATTGPSLATLVSSVNVTLPGACENQAQVELRIITTNAVGNDEWVGIDDISITSSTIATSTVSAVAGTNASEPATNGSFTINYTPTTASTTDVNYSFTGSATFSTDYSVSFSAGTPSTSTSSGILQNIPSGTSSITVTVSPVNDADLEGTETITLTLSSPTGGYVVGAAANINLADDEVAPTVSVVAGANMAEPSTNGTFNFTLSSAAPLGGVTVNYTLTGTATLNTDYSDPQTGSLTIAQGNSGGTVTLTVVDDPTAESTETIGITLNNATNGYAISGGTATITFSDNDPFSLAVAATSYPQDFNTLANSGTSSFVPAGWLFAETSTNANGLYTASTGSSTAGDTYSFGAVAASDRAFGGVRSGGLIPTIGAYFANNTGTTVTTLKITYTGEQWRLGATGRVDRLDFQYSQDATSLITGTWTDVDALDFTAPVSTGSAGALDGNAAPNKTIVSFTISGLSIANGASFFIRWSDPDVAGAEDGLGVDDFAVEANPVDNTPPAVSLLSPANGATGVSVNTTATVSFNEAIQKLSGNILVRRVSDNSIFQSIDVSTAAVSLTSTTASFILSGLSFSTGYYIEIPTGAFEDLAGNDFAGFSGNGTWAFTTGTLLFSANFNSCNSSLSDGYTQYSEVGPHFWACTVFGRDAANPPSGSAPNGVQINGFDNSIPSNVPNTDWLISPSLDLTATTYPLLSFWSRTRFNGLPLQLKVSTNYSSGNPALATWTDLNGKFPAQTSDVWTQSTNINLSAFKTSNVHIAFVYTSSDDEGARWTLDDLQVDNSATPPPASITVSTTDIQFGYTAAGGNSTKSFIVTGNDITSDINLVATTGFQLSTDNVTFNPSVTLPQLSANNVPVTIYVRFAPATNNQNFTGTVTISTDGVTDVVVNLKGTSIDPLKTLEVVNWNIEWFGSTANGPTNEVQQQTNVQTILQNVGADLYGLVEVVDESRLATVVSSMPGYAYVISNYGSHSNPNSPTPSPLNEAQKLAFIYKTSVFSSITTAPLLSQGINSLADISNPAYNYFASGRFPYMMTANVTLDGVTKAVRFVLMHAKANTSPTLTSYDRRKKGSDTLHFTLNNLYPSDNIVILGDFNDDLDQTITDGVMPPITSYSAFTGDAANYPALTLPLSLAGKKSTVSYNDMIDHVVVSSEMASFYMGSSASVLSDVTALVSSYSSSTSDHYPIFTRYAFDATILPVRLLSFSAVKQGRSTKLSWITSGETNSSEFIVERSANGIGWQPVSIVPAAGNSNTDITYSTMDNNPAKGINLYRLKLVDMDNKFDYSSIRKVNFDAAYTYTIYPNPVGKELMITADSSPELNLTLQVFNPQGQVVITQRMNSATQPAKLDVSRLAPGFYFVKILSTDGVVFREKFVKQ